MVILDSSLSGMWLEQALNIDIINKNIAAKNRCVDNSVVRLLALFIYLPRTYRNIDYRIVIFSRLTFARQATGPA